MSDGLDFTIDADRTLSRLDELGAALRTALPTAAEVLRGELLARADQKLSGEVLHTRSGALRASLVGSVHIGAAGFVAEVSADTPYAGILEYGGTIAPHEILPDAARALRFGIGGGVGAVYASVVHHPGAEIAPHSFLRASLAEMEAEIRETFDATVADVLGRT